MLLYSGMTLAIIIMVFIVLFALIKMRQMTDERTAITTENMAKSMEQTYDGLIDTIDIALLTTADELSGQIHSGDMSSQSIEQYLVRQKSRLPSIAFIRVTDEHGNIVYGQDILNPHVNVSDREHFKTLKNNANAGLYISSPLFLRTNNKWVWLFARRINKPDGSFDGTVTASIYVDKLDEMLTKTTLNTGDVATLRDAQLGVIARHVFNLNKPVIPGNKKIAQPFADALRANPQLGTYISGGTSIDAISRTQSYRRSAKYGYYVNVGISREAALEVWHKQAWTLAGLVAAFILATLAFARLITSAWHNQEKSMVTLTEAQEIANLGNYTIDLKTGHWTSSTTLDRILGITPDYPHDAQRIRLDCDREASHNLNRLLDKPGMAGAGVA
ncbi:hypothetical protein SFSGTM_03520 [Sulfuriferula nivalis]|uniref:Cache domain-containing protein n=2 Tax=Sulfuriferula nivalis TaxID=2675298 RepID=A0A809RFJ1_9PROT|nr:hypothetical protein SFSGTM_03520 [Sulfuriferula nivalis]